MPFQWHHYLDVAEHLLQMAESDPQTDAEAYYRAAASRAYYAALKTSEEWLEFYPGSSYTPPQVGQDSHKYVIEYLRDNINGNPTSARSVFLKMTSLRMDRKSADYEPASVVNTWNKRRVELIIEQSRRICNALPGYKLKT